MIQNIWAIGRNYAEHVQELGNQVPDEPMVFLKAGSCLQGQNGELKFAPWLKDVNHEIELALQFDQQLQVSQFYLAIDFTERRLQSELKAKSHPWTLAKSFTGACAISAPLPLKHLAALSELTLELKVNGQLRQQGSVRQMIFPLAQLIEYVKSHFPVVPGDLLLTGTPSGVAAIQSGDRIEISSNMGGTTQFKVL